MKALLAQFETPEALTSAAKKLKAEGHPAMDAFTPFPVEEAMAALDLPRTSLKRNMAIAGFGMAAAAYALEFYSSVFAYPYDSGSRPPNSWPVFLLVPFEVGVLAAAIAGFITLLYECGLPSLYHPIFDARDIDRANEDRFFLAVEGNADKDIHERLRRLLEDERALSVEEVQL
ncbi:MAG: DUF3341 domain-containing protein [Rhodomicrobium sp.]